MRNYRNAFVFALVGNLGLLAVLGGLWWRAKQHPKTEAAMQSPATESAQSPPNGSESAAMASHEAALVPVQLSPERLQSIGVRTGQVESRTVEDEIHATGNVVIDETRLSTVQVRYSGYIQKVFADATYQYLRKGQPLFTIYSPDLVATEREYLVARQNQQHSAKSRASNPRAKSSRNSRSILRFLATSPNATLFRISPFSRRRGFIPSPIFPPFGFWPKCFKTIWEESKSATALHSRSIPIWDEPSRAASISFIPK